MANEGTRRKRIGSVFLWLVAFAGMAIDAIERLQQIVTFVPPAVAPYLPLFYGFSGVAALWLVHSAYKDELEKLARPDVSTVYRENIRHRQEIEQLRENLGVVTRVLDDVQPRTISHFDRAVATTFIRNYVTADERRRSTVFIRPVNSVGDSASLAAQLFEILKRADINVVVDSDLPISNPVHALGIWILGAGGQVEQALAALLKQLGLHAYIEVHPEFLDENRALTKIVVGEKGGLG